MRHLDLFSGIGGFAYAVDQVWQGGVEHIFCDNDPFCQQVIKKHWPGSHIYDDIRKIGSIQAIDIVTGGFPCQPFSQAGARGGTGDDRYLWPEMLAVIQATKPTWVIAENVSGILTWDEGVVFEQVCADLEAGGYEVQPFIIPAVAVGAPHRRDRVWFVAHAKGQQSQNGNVQRRHTEPEQEAVDATNSGNTRSQRPWQRPGAGYGRQPNRDGRNQGHDWGKDWLTLATELCSVDDGLPVKLDGFKLTKSAHRNAQIKAYGNAIVPEIAMEIMKGMALQYT